MTRSLTVTVASGGDQALPRRVDQFKHCKAIFKHQREPLARAGATPSPAIKAAGAAAGRRLQCQSGRKREPKESLEDLSL